MLHQVVSVGHLAGDAVERRGAVELLALAGGAALQLDLAGLDAARADDDLPGQADQVGLGELGARALVAVVVEHLDPGAAQLGIELVAAPRAGLVAGAQVLPDTTIVVTVSKGPQPRPAPALANLTLEQAQAAVTDLQLVLVRGEDVFSNDVPVGQVVLQAPAPDTLVERGGNVTVQLSKGPDLVPLPDLTGLSFTEASRVLAEAGFVIDSLLGTNEGTFVSLTIAGEPVAPGTTFLRGTGVDLIFL